MDISLAILTGGNSKRFGTNKCTFQLGGKTMIEMMLESISFLFSEIIFAGTDPKIKVGKVVPDLHHNKGPVSGLESALMHAKNEYVFLLACDMPFVSPIVIKKMIDIVKDQNILCPFVNKKYQTTHAIYSKNILPIVRKELKRDKSTLTHIVLTASNATFLDERFFHEVERYERSFKNFNSLEELKKQLGRATLS